MDARAFAAPQVYSGLGESASAVLLGEFFRQRR